MNPSPVLGELDFNSMATTTSLQTTRKVRYGHAVLGGGQQNSQPKDTYSLVAFISLLKESSWVAGLIECNYKTSYSCGVKFSHWHIQMGTPSATINLIYKVPTTSLLLYYQTHFVFLHCWYNAMVVAHGAGLSFEQRHVLLTSSIYLFICLFSFGTKNNFTNRNSVTNICNSSCIPFMLSNKKSFF